MALDLEGNLGPTVEHVEPNLGFGLVRYSGDAATIRTWVAAPAPFPLRG